MLNYWLVGATLYLMAMLCVFAFIKGANAKPDPEAEAEAEAEDSKNEKQR